MNMERYKTKRIKMSKVDDPFVNESPQKCIGYIWELTAQLWSLKGWPMLNEDYKELLQI